MSRDGFGLEGGALRWVGKNRTSNSAKKQKKLHCLCLFVLFGMQYMQRSFRRASPRPCFRQPRRCGCEATATSGRRARRVATAISAAQVVTTFVPTEPLRTTKTEPTLISSPATQNWSFSVRVVLGFWDKNTGICAGTMPDRRDFPTRI